MRYLVTHEFVHLEIPDHSKRFWLTVQSLSPDMEKARQWLVVHSERLMVDKLTVVAGRGLWHLPQTKCRKNVSA